MLCSHELHWVSLDWWSIWSRNHKHWLLNNPDSAEWTLNKGQSNLLVDIFCHIRQVATHVGNIVLGCAFGTLILGVRRLEGLAMVPFKRAMVVSYRLSIVTIISLPFGHTQMSVTLKSRGVGSLWGKIWEGREGFTNVSQICTQSGRDMVNNLTHTK